MLFGDDEFGGYAIMTVFYYVGIVTIVRYENSSETFQLLSRELPITFKILQDLLTTSKLPLSSSHAYQYLNHH
jgi:hypothetical protein